MTTPKETDNSSSGPSAEMPSAEIARSLRTARLIAGLALLPLLVLLVRTIASKWYPSGDNAILVLQTSYVFGEHTPLLGPYSRYGWNHPGPLMFYLLAIPYRLTGGQPWAVLTGVVVLNMAAIALLLHVVFTYARERATAIAAFGLTVLGVALTPYVLESPWNPDVTMLPFAAFIALAWATRIDFRWFPATVAMGSFLVQSHAGFAPSVALLGAWCLLHRWTIRPSGRTVFASIAIAVVLWIPVVIDQLFGQQNIGQLAEFFGAEHDNVGLVEALGIAARELVGFAPWMGGDLPPAPGGVAGLPIATLLVPISFYVASIVICRQQSRRNEELFVHAAAVAVVSSTFATSRITDDVAYYLVQFWKPVAMLFWVAVLNVFIGAIAWRSIDKRSTLVFGVATAVVAIPGIAASVNSQVPTSRIQSAMAATFPTTIEHFRDLDPVYIEAFGTNGGWVADALSLEFERNGIDFDQYESQLDKVGQHHIGDWRQSRSHVIIATGDGIAEVERRSNVEPVAEWNGPSTARVESRDEIRILQGPPDERWVIYQQFDDR